MFEISRILIVDDDRVSREVLSEVLKKAGFRPEIAGSAEEALELQAAVPYPIVLSDIRMLALSGLDLLRGIKAASPETVVVLMTAFGSVDGALEAIREGAFDYLSKPFQMDELKLVIARAAKHHELLSKSEPSRSISASATASGLLGRTPKIVEIYKLIARSALSSSSVLITGEAGTGKALIAQTIRKNSSKREAPLLTLSPEDLDALDLENPFGEVRAGTVIVDDLAALSPSRQARLVRAIEYAAHEKLDLRWIALSRKTYRELSETPSEAILELRKDLLYPLSVVVVEIPPLRERSEDLPEMISAYIAKYNERNSKSVSHISSEAMALLTAYRWPGNVRELERVIERAVTLSNTSVLDVEDFLDQIGGVDGMAATLAHSSLGDSAAPSASSGESLEEMEKRHIVGVLRKLSFNKSKAAETLGIDRATLYRKAKLYGISLQNEKKVGME